ncbi:MAG: hypothetical protein HRU41_37180 [Saprospiraceae bacterium]|nr:hypothetical protein [Saprospiraceae bacterium]
MRNNLKILKLILAIAFLVCLLDMPYGYYQLVRFLGMVGFGILAFSAYQEKNQTYFIIWLASALLINPFFKIGLGRDIWNAVDVIWAILLIQSLYTEKYEVNEQENPRTL